MEGWIQTTNTKIAACLGALGIPIRTDVCQDERTGRHLTTFFCGLSSALPGMRHETEGVLRDWKSGALEKSDPWHPFLCGLRAEHNYELLLDAQARGRRLRLAAVAGGHATLYADGDETPQMKSAASVVQTRDLSLAAALGTLGLPVIRMAGQTGTLAYTLPQLGHALLRFPSGEVVRWDAATIMRRAEPGRLDLLLERTEPHHPLVAAYNARHVHNCLRRHLHETGRLVLLRKPCSMRAAYVSENASGRVMDRVARHFQI